MFFKGAAHRNIGFPGFNLSVRCTFCFLCTHPGYKYLGCAAPVFSKPGILAINITDAIH